MEVLLQYLDDLDDLFGVIGLLSERLRTAARKVALLVVVSASTIAGILFALSEPPLGLAVALLLFILLLYRAVTGPVARSGVGLDAA